MEAHMSYMKHEFGDGRQEKPSAQTRNHEGVITDLVCIISIAVLAFLAGTVSQFDIISHELANRLAIAMLITFPGILFRRHKLIMNIFFIASVPMWVASIVLVLGSALK
jgi:hypothetical protein